MGSLHATSWPALTFLPQQQHIPLPGVGVIQTTPHPIAQRPEVRTAFRCFTMERPIPATIIKIAGEYTLAPTVEYVQIDDLDIWIVCNDAEDIVAAVAIGCE